MLCNFSVVKLFNAVSKHQKEMESRLKEAPTEAKKSKGRKRKEPFGNGNCLDQ